MIGAEVGTCKQPLEVKTMRKCGVCEAEVGAGQAKRSSSAQVGHVYAEVNGHKFRLNNSEGSECCLCLDCAKKMVLCPWCNTWHKKEEHIFGDICSKCLMEKTGVCADCGTIIVQSGGRYVDGRMYCENCVYQCEDCGEFHHGIVEECEGCGSCCENTCKCLRDYHGHGHEEYEFHGHGIGPYMGAEIELANCGGSISNNDAAKLAKRENNIGQGFFKCERDCSINNSTGNGVEFITEPSTLEFHKTVNYERVFNGLKDSGFDGGHNCGIHIHVDREWLGSAVPTLRAFMNINKTFFEKFCGRRSCSYGTYIRKDSMGEWGGDLGRDRWASRGEIVNITGENTVEIRAFNSFISPTIIRSFLEMTEALAFFCRNITLSQAVNNSYEMLEAFKEFLSSGDRYSNAVDRMNEVFGR